MSTFDPYYQWLAIPPGEQPPHHYRLLSVTVFEADLDVIDAAADRQMTYLRQCATGEYVKESQQILNELSAARLCLLTPAKKQAYDAELKARLAAAAPAPPSATVPSSSSAPPLAVMDAVGVYRRQQPARRRKGTRQLPLTSRTRNGGRKSCWTNRTLTRPSLSWTGSSSCRERCTRRRLFGPRGITSFRIQSGEACDG